MKGLRAVIRGAALSACTAAATFWAGPAQAEGTFFGGVAVGDDAMAYVGLSTPLPGARLGQGLALRGIVGGGRYKYDTAVGRVRGEDLRADLSLVYQVSDADTYFDVGLGARYVDTNLSPADPGNPRRGSQWEAVVSASGQQTFGRWAASQFGSYGFDGRDYYVRGDISRTVFGPTRLGVEVQADGARDYARRRLGALLGLSLSSGWSIKLAAGVSDQADETTGYGGLSFQASF